ncbi:MAG: 50S ribosomal protein L21 [Holosporaceae bacterium]|jgi:large subunit ribosomal protein L21|nr:50S ribosomal protein L21 [Holosporaceae bacterium]
MLAVVRTGGKQYKVTDGDFIAVQKLPQETGTKVELSDVLMIEDHGKMEIGAPLVAGASVSAVVVDQKKMKTVLIFKKRRRKNHRRKNGHRQQMTILQVECVRRQSLGG